MGKRKLNPTIKLEKQIGEQIYNALQGSVVEEVLRKMKISSSDAYWRSSMEGHSLKVQQELLPDFYALCQDVKKKLGFDDPVDFYITGDSEVNAFSVAAEEEGKPHIVNVNSELFTLMSEAELRFVLGHELGHLINKDTALARLINFVFPPEAAVPVTLQYKIRLHEQLAELVADRYGYMATEDLGVCVTAFFKMASGLDLEKMNVSIDALIADNTKRLEYFLKGKGISRSSHPVNPIRVQALNLFATVKTQKELQEGMDELITILLKVGDDEMDEYMARFIASAGLIVVNCDGEVHEEEVNQVIETLAALKIFPRQYLEEIAKGDIPAIFNDSVENILKINPGVRVALLEYMISIVMSDKKIAPEEIKLLYNFGESIALSEMEVATAIAEAIQRRYMPSLESIC
ncbi:MAG: M48 family metalloprotease [Muribaculaceae bacterium]|nr:M48 family metalloprotease [Muribaculaceae bacterium]MBQ2563158.1 M48 family metalloprotease [Muribaculaceae bacterium]MDY6413165.1 M48 family metallopeptidase [Bacteroidales bacterium]